MGVPLVGLMCRVDEADEEHRRWDYAGGGMVSQMRCAVVHVLSACTTWSSGKGVFSLNGKLDLMHDEWMGMRCFPD